MDMDAGIVYGRPCGPMLSVFPALQCLLPLASARSLALRPWGSLATVGRPLHWVIPDLAQINTNG